MKLFKPSFQKSICFFLSVLLTIPTYGQSAFSREQIVFEGTLADASGNRIDLSGNQPLRFSVVAKDGSNNDCYLFSEESLASGSSNGDISHKIGTGTHIGGASFSASLFAGSRSGSPSVSGFSLSCSVSANSDRFIKVTAPNFSGLAITMALTSVPYAQEAHRLGGYSPTDFVLSANSSVNTLLNGGTTGQVLTKSGSALQWVDSSTFTSSGSGVVSAAAGITSISAGSGISITGSSFSPIVNLLPSGAAAGSYTKITLDSFGRVTMGSFLTSSDIISALGYAPASGGAVVSGPAGIVSFNGVSSENQFMAYVSGGTTPGFYNSGSNHYFRIPYASETSVLAGLISNAKYQYFSNKLDGFLSSGQIFIGNGSNVATGVMISGDANLSASGILSLNPINTSKITSGTLPVVRGGTGLGITGPANSFLTTNNSATGLEYKTFAAGSNVTISTSGTVITISSLGGASGGASVTPITVVGIASETIVTNSSSGTFAVGLAPTAFGSGVFTKIAFDNYGRVIHGEPISYSDVVNALGFTPSAGGGGSATAVTVAGTPFQIDVNQTASSTYTISLPNMVGINVGSGPVTRLDVNGAIRMGYEGFACDMVHSGSMRFVGGNFEFCDGSGSWKTAFQSGVASATATIVSGTAGEVEVTQTGPDTFTVGLPNMVGINNAFPVTRLDVGGAIKIGFESFPCDSMRMGAIRFNAGVMELCSNSMWKTLSVEGDLVHRSEIPSCPVGQMLHYSNVFNNFECISLLGNLGAVSGSMVLIGPASGAANATFRTLLPSDLPAFDTLTVSAAVIVRTLKLTMPASGSQTGFCTMGEEGSQRYNTSFKTMEYCDGNYWQGLKGVTQCPTVSGGVSYTLIGVPGTAGAFCISSNRHSNAVYNTAVNSCMDQPTSSGRARLCDESQINMACKDFKPGMEAFGASSVKKVWVSSFQNGATSASTLYFATADTATCSVNSQTGTIEARTTPLLYRCCYQ